MKASKIVNQFNKNHKGGKNMRKLLSVLMIFMLILTGCGAKEDKEIQLKDYIVLETDGNNGVAEGRVVLDDDLFLDEVERLKGDLDAAKEYVEKLEIEFELNGKPYQLGVSPGLMNDDEVKVLVTDDEALREKVGVKIVAENFTIKVKDLEGAVVISNEDLYADIKLIEKDGKVVVVNESTHPVVRGIDFEVSEKDGAYEVKAKIPEKSQIEVKEGVKPAKKEVEKPAAKPQEAKPKPATPKPAAPKPTGNVEADIKKALETVFKEYSKVKGKEFKAESFSIIEKESLGAHTAYYFTAELNQPLSEQSVSKTFYAAYIVDENGVNPLAGEQVPFVRPGTGDDTVYELVKEAARSAYN